MAGTAKQKAAALRSVRPRDPSDLTSLKFSPFPRIPKSVDGRSFNAMICHQNVMKNVTVGIAIVHQPLLQCFQKRAICQRV